MQDTLFLNFERVVIGRRVFIDNFKDLAAPALADVFLQDDRKVAQERVELDQQQRPRKKRRSRWLLTPKTARDALVFTEILGRPKSEREGEDFG